jgi:hypothetical protein
MDRCDNLRKLESTNGREAVFTCNSFQMKVPKTAFQFFG